MYVDSQMFLPIWFVNIVVVDSKFFAELNFYKTAALNNYRK